MIRLVVMDPVDNMKNVLKVTTSLRYKMNKFNLHIYLIHKRGWVFHKGIIRINQPISKSLESTNSEYTSELEMLISATQKVTKNSVFTTKIQ